MAGAAGVGAGLGIMGGILGGVGDIMSAANYERPSVPEPGGQERRLRQLANSQLLAGGQQLLGGTALYNQLAPLLMGMLPGMHYTPGEGGGGDGGSGGGGGLDSYSDALARLQEAQANQQRLTELKAAMKGAKKGPAKKAARQELKALKKTIKSQPTVAQRERQSYLAGTQPDSSMFNIQQAPAGAPPMGGGGGDMGGMSLAAIRGMMDADNGSGPNFMDLYNQGGGGY